MEKALLESVVFTDYRFSRYTSAKKGFERLRESSGGVVLEFLQHVLNKHSQHVWFRLPAPKKNPNIWKQKALFFILLIGLKYPYVPFMNW